VIWPSLLNSVHCFAMSKEIKIEISDEELKSLHVKIGELKIDEGFKNKLTDLLKMVLWLKSVLSMKDASIAKSEKSPPKPPSDKKPGKKGRREGQGNNTAGDFPNAEHRDVKLIEYQPGDPCPKCDTGKLYPWESGISINIEGSPLLEAVIYHIEKLRCNSCGEIISAPFSLEKYSPSAKAIICLMHYSASVPFYRLEKLQRQFLTPVSRSVQWELVNDAAEVFEVIYLLFIEYLKKSPLLYADDTKAKVLSMMGKLQKIDGKDRKALYTTVISGKCNEAPIVAYFTGHSNSGENLDKIITQDTSTVVMTDASSSNNGKYKRRSIYCLTHGRRQFKDIEKNFESECKHVISLIGIAYKNDSETREMSDQLRLEYHQKNSTAPMSELHSWMLLKLEKKEVEPNSSLGHAIRYLLKHWEKLTGFLRIPGAPLDNNLAEQLLRKSVLDRKNFLFYKTERGAYVGDIHSSVLMTCDKNKINGYRYQIWVLENRSDVPINPEKYLPWNFKDPGPST